MLFFPPKAFSTFSEAYPATGHVEENVRKFCETYRIDSHRCAIKLYSFATAFKLFNFDTPENKTDHADYGHVSDEFSDGTEDTDDEYGVDMQDKHQTFVDCLSVLTDSRYKLIDAYPTLVRVYSIALAIPITSCSAERSFSTLKRVKTRLRSSVLQDRLEGLMLMSIERRILMRLDKEKLVELLGKSWLASLLERRFAQCFCLHLTIGEQHYFCKNHCHNYVFDARCSYSSLFYEI